MSEKKHNLKAGDSVIVKPGTKDPDLGGDISGWQGRITEFSEYEGDPTVMIAWDSITLKEMPHSMIAHCEKEVLDWKVMGLDMADVEPASPRDSARDIKRAVEEIYKHSAWLHPDEEGERIQQVLTGMSGTTRQLRAWEKHLERTLTFPFEAEVSEYQERGPVRTGDPVKVKSIFEADDHYGIIVEVRRGREKFWFPLCELKVTDRQSTNSRIVDDYGVWFANR